MKRRLFWLLSVLLLTVGSIRSAETAVPPATAQAFPLEAYAAVGSVFARNSRLEELGWNEAQFDAFIEGVRAAFKGKPYPFDARAQALHETIGRRLKLREQDEAQARRKDLADPAKLESSLKEAARKYRMERAESGLGYTFLAQVSGPRPGPEDSVVITWQVADALADAMTPLPQLNVTQKRAKVADLLPGLAEAVQMMSAGSTAVFLLPPDLSFGAKAWPSGVERGMPLLFMVALEQVIPAP